MSSMIKWKPLSEALSDVLYDSVKGYYANRLPVGKSGDFITAPEISQVFGEMVGIWCVDEWQKAGCPKDVSLVELGPGSGRMMLDILRVISLIPDLMNSIGIHLVDVCSVLKSQQKEILKAYDGKIFWHDSVSSLPKSGYKLIVANEFFDALPIDQYYYRDSEWYQRGMLLSQGQWKVEDHVCSQPELRFEPSSFAVIEVCLFHDSIVKSLSECVLENGGSILIIDYGDDLDRWEGETLQAVKDHRKCSLWDNFGEADLSHHVDFRDLKERFRQFGVVSHSFENQSAFLKRMGVEARANQLAQVLHESKRSQHFSAVHRLISHSEMGDVFKVLHLRSTTS